MTTATPSPRSRGWNLAWFYATFVQVEWDTKYTIRPLAGNWDDGTSCLADPVRINKDSERSIIRHRHSEQPVSMRSLWQPLPKGGVEGLAYIFL